MAMDLEAWDTEETAEMELQHPIDGPSGVFLTVCAKGSERWQQARSGHQRRFKALTKQYGTEERIPQQEREDAVREWLTDMVVGWRGVTVKGEPVEFSRSNAARLLAKADIADQVLTFVGSTANFMRRSPSAS